MAPEIAVAVRSTAAEGWEIKLARTVVYRRALGFTLKTRKALVVELLRRLRMEQNERELQNLNHWEQYAPARIPELTEQLLHERAERIGAHIKLNRKTMASLGWRITRNQHLADASISRTCESLWIGKTSPELSSRSLKMDARDELAKRDRERKRYEPLDTPSMTVASRRELSEDLEVQAEPQDFISNRAEDQDPLEILIQREEQAEFNRKVQEAFQHPRWRDLKHRKWAKPLKAIARK